MANPTIVHNGYVEVLIESRKYGSVSFKVDNDVWDKIKEYRWGLAPRNTVTSKFYIQNRRLGLLHRFIMNYPKNKCIDHINRDTLDNRRSNLRIVSKGENSKNRAGYGSLTYKFISHHTRYDRKRPRSFYIVNFPDFPRKQIIKRNDAYAYYIDCLLTTGANINE